MENAAGKARRGRIHSQNSIPVSRLNWSGKIRSQLEKLRSREPSQPALSYEHVKNFAKDSEVRQSWKPGQPGQPGSYERTLAWNRVKSFITVGEDRGWEGHRGAEREGQEVGDLKGWEVGEKEEIIQQGCFRLRETGGLDHPVPPPIQSTQTDYIAVNMNIITIIIIIIPHWLTLLFNSFKVGGGGEGGETPYLKDVCQIFLL